MHAAPIAALALLALAAGAIAGHIEEEHHHHHSAPYKFAYEVHDPHHGDVKSHHESGHGGQVKGSYSLVEPDGHVRKVEYTADKHSGFQAVVHREGKTTLHGFGEHDTKGLEGDHSSGHHHESSVYHPEGAVYEFHAGHEHGHSHGHEHGHSHGHEHAAIDSHSHGHGHGHAYSHVSVSHKGW